MTEIIQPLSLRARGRGALKFYFLACGAKGRGFFLKENLRIMGVRVYASLYTAAENFETYTHPTRLSETQKISLIRKLLPLRDFACQIWKASSSLVVCYITITWALQEINVSLNNQLWSFVKYTQYNYNIMAVHQRGTYSTINFQSCC